jgi:hypothetical protein
MGIENIGHAGQVPSEPSGQVPTPANAQAAAANPNATQQQAQRSADEYERMIADLRKENATHRTKLSAFEKAQQEAEAAKLSDLERTAKERDTFKTQADAYRSRIAVSDLKLAAHTAGIIDPEDALAHLLGKVEYDEAGEPKNVAKLVEDLKAAKAHLFRSGPQTQQPAVPARPNPGATNPGRGAPTQPTRIEPGQMARFGRGQRLFGAGQS